MLDHDIKYYSAESLTDSFPTKAVYSTYCQCKTPCQITSYLTSVSQVKISDFAANLFVLEEKFGDEVFAQYLMGMMFRDWVLVRGTGSTDLVDAIYSVVYSSITPAREAYNVLTDSKRHKNLIPEALSCETNNSQQFCQEDLFSNLETLSEGSNGKRPLSEWYRPYIVLQRVELEVDLAHKLLRKSEYESTLVAQLGHNCSVAVSVLDDVLADISTNCNTTCANSPNVTLVFKELTSLRDMFYTAHESVRRQKFSYDVLLQNVSASVGKWYLPWNEKGLDAGFYR